MSITRTESQLIIKSNDHMTASLASDFQRNLPALTRCPVGTTLQPPVSLTIAMMVVSSPIVFRHRGSIQVFMARETQLAVESSTMMASRA